MAQVIISLEEYESLRKPRKELLSQIKKQMEEKRDYYYTEMREFLKLPYNDKSYINRLGILEGKHEAFYYMCNFLKRLE